MEQLLYILLGSVFWGLLTKWLGPSAVAEIKHIAKRILQDPEDPITDPKEAVEKAIIEWRFEHGDIDEAIRELEKEQAKGRIVAQRARELDERAAANPNPTTTVVPLDGTEKWSQPFKPPAAGGKP